jgi:DNA-binding transcriptional LysR family regulator
VTSSQTTAAPSPASRSTFELTQPAAGLLDRSTDIAFVRPPIAAPGLSLEQVGEEPRVFVLASDRPLAGGDQLGLDDVAGLPWIAAATTTESR